MNDAEVNAAWERLCEEHIKPSVIFLIASGLGPATDEEIIHLAECAECRSAYEKYLE